MRDCMNFLKVLYYNGLDYLIAHEFSPTAEVRVNAILMHYLFLKMYLGDAQNPNKLIKYLRKYAN